MNCPTCKGDGIERCTNPDHGFSFTYWFNRSCKIDARKYK